MNANTRILDLTVCDLQSVIKECQQPQQAHIEVKKERKFVKGYKGVMDIFQCSISTAQRIKKSGLIDKAIFQVNRTFIVDFDMALELARNTKVKLR